MSLRMLKKQVGATESEVSEEAKAAVSHQPRRGAGRGSGVRSQGYASGGGGYDAGGGSSGSYYAQGSRQRNSTNGEGEGGGDTSESGAPRVMAPTCGGFRGSTAQSAHVEAMRQATAKAAAERVAVTHSSDLSLRSGLGLDAIREKKRREEEERQARREAARAKRHDEATQKELDDEHALAECEAQARADCERIERVSYEAALVIRITIKFGAGSAWTKIAEARARGANIPLDPRRIYLLAHPDKCPLEEASDATAILNAQRPPEMTEAKVKPAPARHGSVMATNGQPPAPGSAEEARAKRMAARAAAAAEARDATEGVVDGSADNEVQATPAAAENLSASAANAPAATTPAAPAAVPSTSEALPTEEQRIDPEDNKPLTLKELRTKYAGQYSEKEINAYWKEECRPKPKKVASKRY